MQVVFCLTGIRNKLTCEITVSFSPMELYINFNNNDLLHKVMQNKIKLDVKNSKVHYFDFKR